MLSIVKRAGETSSHVLCAHFHSRHVQPSTFDFYTSSSPFSGGIALSFFSNVPNQCHSNKFELCTSPKLASKNNAFRASAAAFTIIFPFPNSTTFPEIDKRRSYPPPMSSNDGPRILIFNVYSSFPRSTSSSPQGLLPGQGHLPRLILCGYSPPQFATRPALALLASNASIFPALPHLPDPTPRIQVSRAQCPPRPLNVLLKDGIG